MKRNARDREREYRFANVLDTDTGGLLRLMRPVFRRIVRRAVWIIFYFYSKSKFSLFFSFQQADGDQTDEDEDDDDDDDDEDEDMRHARHIYSFDCAPS